jgi:glycosyltransferase involved in cell wall biosynthesis
MPAPLRVAYTLEQCWHDVPGGSAAAPLEVARRLIGHPDVELIGVAGRHRHQAGPAFVPPIAVQHLPLARPWLYEAWNRFEWPPVERATGPVDVCHSTIAIPAPTKARRVVTVHDVAFVDHPERFTRHGARVMRAGLERCRTADLVLCPSRATIADLAGLGFDESRVRHVPWGVSAVPVTDEDRARVRSAYALPDTFVLFVGTVEPRKNVARLAEAAAALGVPLVVAGAAGWGEIDHSRLEARFLGFVPAADLPAVYAVATVFAYPSLNEGFGLPILEAMSYGLPVVTSQGSATEEVAGDAAVLVDAHEVDAIRAGLEAALADPARWSGVGRKRAAGFTWQAAADATVAAYRELAA